MTSTNKFEGNIQSIVSTVVRNRFFLHDRNRGSLYILGSEGKESACKAGDLALIPGLGRSTGEGNGNSLQYSCLENSMDREAWLATVMGMQRRHD